MAIILAILLAFLLQLAIWEGVAYAIIWAINSFTSLTVSFEFVGAIIFGIWFVILLIKALFIYGAYKG